MVANAMSMSLSLPAWTTRICCPTFRAASCASRNRVCKFGLFGFCALMSQLGPNSAVSRFLRHGCFTPETGHCSALLGRQKSARSRHMRCSKFGAYSITSHSIRRKDELGEEPCARLVLFCSVSQQWLCCSPTLTPSAGRARKGARRRGPKKAGARPTPVRASTTTAQLFLVQPVLSNGGPGPRRLLPTQSVSGHALRDRLHLVRSEALELRRVSRTGARRPQQEGVSNEDASCCRHSCDGDRSPCSGEGEAGAIGAPPARLSVVGATRLLPRLPSE